MRWVVQTVICSWESSSKRSCCYRFRFLKVDKSRLGDQKGEYEVKKDMDCEVTRVASREKVERE